MMKFETVYIETLHFDPANARKHDKKNVKAIAASLAKFGQQKPIVVDADNIVIAGNGTMEAAKSLGWEKITIHRTDLRGPEAVAFAIADNRTAELAEWEKDTLGAHLQGLREDGWDLEDLGFELSDLEDLIDEDLSSDGLTDPDDVPDVAENIHSVERGQIWQLGDHRIMCGDSTSKEDVERLMAGEKADMVITDPPYNVSYGEMGHEKFKDRKIQNDSMTTEEYRVFCKAWIDRLIERCDGVFYVWGPPGPDGRALFTILDNEIHHSTTVVWNKNCMVLGRGKYQNKYELCWFGWNKSGKSFSEDRSITNVWDFDKPSKSVDHPMMKPIGLLEIPINHNPDTKSVLDLFLGSGSTLIACEKTNRTCYGMEIDPHYCSVIIERWQEFTGKKAELIV